jgi:hypothetical protein
VIPSCRYVTAITVSYDRLPEILYCSLDRSFSGLELAARFRIRKVISCL